MIDADQVGPVTAAILASMAGSVACLDIDTERVLGTQEVRVPIHEHAPDRLVELNVVAGSLQLTIDAAKAVAHGTIVLVALGTPPAEDGPADVP